MRAVRRLLRPGQVVGVLRAVLLALEAGERKVAWLLLLLRLGRPVRIHPFSGFGTGDWALLGGRVLVGAPPRPGSARTSRWGALRANLLPFLSVEVPGAQVRVTLGGREVVARRPRGLPPGADRGRPAAARTASGDSHPVQPAGEPAVGTVHVPDPAADLAVVSDVDDTIVDSGIAHGLAATLGTMLLQDQSTRVPLTGAAELYRALAKGAPGTVERPFFYLSTSPWNLAGFLQGFLARHRFPDGPLVLTDWGPGADSLLRISSRTHKLSTLRQLAQALPRSRFVLIGDSGQQDPAIYADFCAEHPGRVAAVYIRRAGAAGPASDQRTEQAERLLAEVGVPYVIADDTDAMLRHAVEHGLVARAGDVPGR